MAQARASSRSSLLSSKASSRSNNNAALPKRSVSYESAASNTPVQKTKSSLKVLGQDEEITEDMLYDLQTDRQTPLSSRSKPGSRPISSASKRTPTPSKQVSLQAVKRKEEKEETLEPINWDDFKDKDNRVPSLPVSDSDSDELSPRSTPLSAAERLALIEQRTREMTSALSSRAADDIEADLSRKLDLIDHEREEIERKQREEEEKNLRKSGQALTVEDGQFTYRNEHFRDLSRRDEKDKISGTFIFDGKSIQGANSSSETKLPRQREGNMFDMDKPPDTAVSAESQKEHDKELENTKKNEASAQSDDDDDSSDDDDTDEDDIIGEKGKAPNALLMEFLGCMMEEDYENAEKLCKMILIYEPENPEALSFYPLIQEKIKQEAEESDEGDSSDESDDSGEEEDSDNDDSDDDDDDDESGSNEDEEGEAMEGHADSGIASANSD